MTGRILHPVIQERSKRGRGKHRSTIGEIRRGRPRSEIGRSASIAIQWPFSIALAT